MAFLCVSCVGLWPRLADPLDPSIPPLKIVVAQVVMKAPITHSADIYSFEEAPSLDRESVIRAQLIEEIELSAHRRLIEALASQAGFSVMPFPETRRLLADNGAARGPLSKDQLRMVGRTSGADVVVSAEIDDYGRLRWSHWVGGMVDGGLNPHDDRRRGNRLESVGDGRVPGL